MKIIKVYFLIFFAFYFKQCISLACTNEPVGIENCGNSCYLNSILQSIFRCDIITNFLLNPQSENFYKADNLPNVYRNFVINYNDHCLKNSTILQKTTIEPLYTSVTKSAKLKKGEQGDAQEALTHILDKLCSREYLLDELTINTLSLDKCPTEYQQYQEKMKTSKKKDDLVDNLLNCVFQKVDLEKSLYEYFNLKQKSTITCLRCNTQSTTIENSLIVSTSITQKTKSVQEALNDFSTKANLTKSDQFRCKQCQSLQDIEKVLIITVAPEYLTVHLKIFEQNLDGSRNKIKCTPNLNLENLKLPNPALDIYDYELFASSWHSGTFSGGHYIAIVKSGNEWYECNDDTINIITMDDFQDGQFKNTEFTPYLLFYKRVNIVEKRLNEIYTDLATNKDLNQFLKTLDQAVLKEIINSHNNDELKAHLNHEYESEKLKQKKIADLISLTATLSILQAR